MQSVPFAKEGAGTGGTWSMAQTHPILLRRYRYPGLHSDQKETKIFE